MYLQLSDLKGQSVSFPYAHQYPLLYVVKVEDLPIQSIKHSNSLNPGAIAELTGRAIAYWEGGLLEILLEVEVRVGTTGDLGKPVPPGNYFVHTRQMGPMCNQPPDIHI